MRSSSRTGRGGRRCNEHSRHWPAARPRSPSLRSKTAAAAASSSQQQPAASSSQQQPAAASSSQQQPQRSAGPPRSSRRFHRRCSHGASRAARDPKRKRSVLATTFGGRHARASGAWTMSCWARRHRRRPRGWPDRRRRAAAGRLDRPPRCRPLGAVTAVQPHRGREREEVSRLVRRHNYLRLRTGSWLVVSLLDTMANARHDPEHYFGYMSASCIVYRFREVSFNDAVSAAAVLSSLG